MGTRTLILTTAFLLILLPRVFGQEDAERIQASEIRDKEVVLNIPERVVEGVEQNVILEVVGAEDLDGELNITVNGTSRKIHLEDGKATFKYAFEDHDLSVTFGEKEISVSSSPIPLWMSILPPLIAIFMALLLREVIVSLFTGIFVGAAVIGWYGNGIAGVIGGFFEIIDRYIIGALNDWGHLAVILFSMMIGGIVALISRNGGMRGVVDRISGLAKDTRSGQLSTWILGIAIFFDDYANTLVVGNTMRPVTDRLKISREKLSYLVDSTAAPIAAIAFITTWVGAELGYIQDGLNTIAEQGSATIDQSVYGIFMNSLSYSFYPILTLIFIFILVMKRRDFGPMLKAERKARASEVITASESEEVSSQDKEMEELNMREGIKPNLYNALLPIGVIILGTIYGLIHTGTNACYSSLQEAGIQVGESFGAVWGNLQNLPKEPTTFFEKLGTLIGNSDSYFALLWASLGGLFLAVLMTVGKGLMKVDDAIESVLIGFKTMLGTMIILILAWSLATVTEDMHTAEFLTGIMGDSIAPWAIPVITFILSALVAFSTGSSWGTMAILYPLMLPAAWKICQVNGYETQEALEIFYNVTSCVLAGAVLGDHCSPISDTTILSSLASSCNHIDHVQTQLPYALTVGGVAILFGTIPGSFGVPFWINLPVGIGILYLIVHFFGRPTEQQVSLNTEG